MLHLLGKGERNYINGPGQMTKMAAMPIFGKNIQKSSPYSPMILKLGMEHYVLKLYKVYINDDPELTLTYFTTMSNLAIFFLYLQKAQISGECLQDHWSSGFNLICN